MVATRTDTALSVHDLEEGVPVVTFPAPWPSAAGGVDAVAPSLELAVFTGLHAVRAVGTDGRARWEIPHACWACEDIHDAAEEYAGDAEHRYPDHGSAGFAADGRTVWAHVRAPLADADVRPPPDDPSVEAWLVIDVSDGNLLGRAGTETYAAGSHHICHPDPTVMGLSVGEGQDGSPALWGRWRDGELHIDRLDGDDRILVAAGPGGRTFLTVGHTRGQELTVHRLADHIVLGTVFADALPSTGPLARWDLQCGLLNDRVLLASTSDKGHGETGIRHWLIDVDTLEVRGPVRYPDTVPANPISLGDGTWLTTGQIPDEMNVWQLPS